MKAIVCEMCGSRDVIKKDDFYVCEYCGTKYSVEEARKIMVDVSGSTVKIDVSDRINKMFEVARRAKGSNNPEIAAKYYEMILVEEPSNWEANFYSSYFLAVQTNIANISSAAYTIMNSAILSIDLIKDHINDENEHNDAISQIVFSVIDIAEMLRVSAKKHYNEFSFEDVKQQRHKQEYIDRICAISETLYAIGDAIETKMVSEFDLKLASQCWQKGITINRSLLNLLSTSRMEDNKTTIDKYESKACKYDRNLNNQVIQRKIYEIDREINDTNKKYRPGCGCLAGILLFSAFVSFFSKSCESGINIEAAIIILALAVISFICMFRSPKNIKEQQEKIKVLEDKKELLEKELKK